RPSATTCWSTSSSRSASCCAAVAPPDAPMDPAAQRHLAGQLDHARAVLAQPSIMPFDRGAFFGSYGGARPAAPAVCAVRAVGAISAEEETDWRNRLFDVYGIEVPAPPSGRDGAKTISAVFVGDPDSRPAPLVIPEPAGSLVRAIVVPDAAWRYASGTFQ